VSGLGVERGVDEREFEGVFVLESTPGCYKWLIVIDGNSFYDLIMSKVGTFIDRCFSS
jgi:DNA polymerase elongation subunit (family B)